MLGVILKFNVTTAHHGQVFWTFFNHGVPRSLHGVTLYISGVYHYNFNNGFCSVSYSVQPSATLWLINYFC